MVMAHWQMEHRAADGSLTLTEAGQSVGAGAVQVVSPEEQVLAGVTRLEAMTTAQAGGSGGFRGASEAGNEGPAGQHGRTSGIPRLIRPLQDPS
jgi:hypothetical protein